MKFLLDESADYALAGVLRSLGYDVTAVAHDYPNALRDRDVLAIANSEERIILTSARDFGELIFRHHMPHFGVIYFRLGSTNISTKAAWLVYVVTQYADQLREFIVVTERSIRVRTTK